MRAFVLSGLCLLTAASLAAQAAAVPVSISDPSPDDFASGQRVFESQCTRCHGVGGTGGIAPMLTTPRLGRAPDDSALVQVIADGIPGTAMAGFWNLSEVETRQVAAYVRALGRRPVEPIPGDAAHGREIYYGKGNCQRCHVLTGAGAGWAPDLTEVGLRLSVFGLRQSLLEPGASQPVRPLPSVHGPYPAFLAVEAVTGSGAIIRGTRVTESDFTIVIRTADGRLRSLDKVGLRQLQKIPGRSPMPAYGELLTAEELEDLVAFLASQRGRP